MGRYRADLSGDGPRDRPFADLSSALARALRSRVLRPVVLLSPSDPHRNTEEKRTAEPLCAKAWRTAGHVGWPGGGTAPRPNPFLFLSPLPRKGRPDFSH